MTFGFDNTLKKFWVLGVNYRKSDTKFRSAFAIDDQQYEEILDIAPNYNINDFFIISTCNRTEIYGFAADPKDLAALLCTRTNGSESEFFKEAYIKQGNDAILQLFNVSGGLDSQILGDYEIVGQMKKAFQLAQNHGKIGQITDRLFKSSLSASRAIRSETQLSTGTVSVAYATILYLKKHIQQLQNKHILVVGAGSMGTTICRDLKENADLENITIINRTFAKAESLAKELDIKALPFENLFASIHTADIIIVTTAAQKPIINMHDNALLSNKYIIDLSIPHNVDPNIQSNPQIHLVDVDELSKINDETLKMRQAEVPKAHALITYHIHQFAEWYLMLTNVPVIKEVKKKLIELNEELYDLSFQQDGTEAIQKAINEMALKLRKKEGKPGCNVIEAISSYLDFTPEKDELRSYNATDNIFVEAVIPVHTNTAAGKCPFNH